MSGPTRNDVRERIGAIALASTLVKTFLNGAECYVPPENLPALYVVPRQSSGRDYTNAQRRLVTVNYDLLLLYEELCSDDEQVQFAALERAWDMADALPDYFANSAPRLMLKGTDAGMAGINSIDHMADIGTQFTDWGGKVYAATMYTLPVITERAAPRRNPNALP